MVEYKRTSVTCGYCGKNPCSCGAENYSRGFETFEVGEVEGLLLNTAKRFRELDQESADRLHNHDDVDGYRDRLVQRAQLVVDLPQIIQEMSEIHPVDPGLLTSIKSLAGTARSRIKEYEKDGSTFGLGVLFTPWGSKIGEPNDFESTITNFFPDCPLPFNQK